MSANPGINHGNSQHSTGPKTEESKKKSSLKALRHGLTGQIVVMPSKDIQAYRLHLDSFKTDLQPKGSIEAHLVRSLADTAHDLNEALDLLETTKKLENLTPPPPMASFFQSPNSPPPASSETAPAS